MQIQQIGVKMLEARSCLWHNVKSLLLWICEIHFVQWRVKLPRPGCYLHVSYHVIQFSYLYFTSLPFTFHALLLTTKQWVHHCPLYTTTHPASQVDVSNHGSLLWSEQDVSRIEHKVLHLQYCWFLWTEASAQTPFSLQELTKWMSNQTASSCLLLMLLLPEVAKSKGYESRAAPMALQPHWPAPLTWGLGQAQWLAAACSYISVSRIMPHWK